MTPDDTTTTPAEAWLRTFAWKNHGCPISALYGDDGERQCSQCGMDFRRATLAELGRWHHDRMVSALSTRPTPMPPIEVGDVVTDYIRGREVTPGTVEWWNASPLAKPNKIERNGVVIWTRPEDQ